MSTDNSLGYNVDQELAALLKAAARAGRLLRVRAGDEVFDLEVRPAGSNRDIWDHYDPEAARTAWHTLAGLLDGVDADELMREAREQHSSSRSFP